MKIKILGTGTAVPSLKRLSSSYLVTTEWGNMLIDIGPSVVRRLLESGCTVDDIDMIVLTHFHPDHTVDLTTFLFACNYGEKEREKPLVLLGGKGVRNFYRRLRDVYPWIAPIRYTLRIKSLPRGTWQAEGVSIRTAAMKHRDESIGVQITEKGKTAIFSGDTDHSEALVRLASKADLLVAECSFPAWKAEGHMNLPTLLSVVKKARPKIALMSHLYPAWQTFDGVLPPPLLLAEDGMEINV